MLSLTHTIEDVKQKLKKDYSYYGYESDEDFDDDLTSVCDDVYRLYFLQYLGSSEYTRIQTKDRVNLTTTETYLYWAEVFATCHDFLAEKTAVDGQLQNSSDETLTVEGYTHKVGSGGSGGASQGDNSLSRYYGKMYSYFKRAGIDIAAIQRTCTIFGDSEYPEDLVLDIIE